MPAVVTIDGAVVTLNPGWRIDAAANGRASLNGSVVSTNASYRPSIDDEIIFVNSLGTSATSTTVGTGSKTFTTQAGLPLVVGQRVRVWRAAAGAELTYLEGAITAYSGTSLTVLVDVVSGTGTHTDWLIGIREFGGELQTVDEAGLGGHGVTPIRSTFSALDFNGYLDRIYVNGVLFAGTLKSMLVTLVDLLDADSAGFGVTLDANQVNGPTIPDLTYPFVLIKDVFEDLTRLSTYTREIDYDKVLRMYAPGTRTAPFNIAADDGNTIGDVCVRTTRVPSGSSYANRVFVVWSGTPEVPVYAMAENASEQTAHGLWEVVVTVSGIPDAATATTFAAAYLAEQIVRPKEVDYLTYRSGIRPGQTQTITLPKRSLSGTFTIKDVRTFAVGNVIRYAVTASQGTVLKGGWRQQYQQWSGARSSMAVAVITGGSVSASGRKAYYLGGSAPEYVQSSSPDWIAASAVQIVVDTVERGTTDATVTVRLRSRSGSVTARLRNMTDGSTVGTSGAVTSTSWQTTTFAVTLTAGTKTYELQLLPGSANVDVAGVGFME